MSERSLIFTSESIHGIQRKLRGEVGGKSQTRRTIPVKVLERPEINFLLDQAVKARELAVLAPVQPGNLIRARERWCPKFGDNGIIYRPDGNTYELWYQADNPEVIALDDDGARRYLKNGAEASPWWSPLYMPKWASRYWLPCVSVRCERLQDITEADAIAEGCNPEPIGVVPDDSHPDVKALAKALGPGMWSAKFMYLERWEEINGEGSWAKNPWVWVYEWNRVITEQPA